MNFIEKWPSRKSNQVEGRKSSVQPLHPIQLSSKLVGYQNKGNKKIAYHSLIAINKKKKKKGKKRLQIIKDKYIDH